MTLTKIYIQTVVALVCIAFFSSCKKEESNGPVVHINYPMQGQGFTAGDTVSVSATVTDDQRVTSIIIRLLNASYISCDHDEGVPISGNNLEINKDYVISNINLETGDYYIAVIASDGNNVTNEYVRIHINELPKERKGIFILSASNPFSFAVSRLDALNNPVSVTNLNGDYVSSAIYSRNHELFTIGSISGSFNAYDLDGQSFLWSYPPTGFSIPTFMNLFLIKDRIYVSYYDGNIKGYDMGGVQKFEAQQQGYFIPDVIFRTDQYFFSEIFYRGSHQNKLGVFYFTGAEKQERAIDIDLKNMYSLDQDHLLLFGNDSVLAQGKIEIYDIPGNGTVSLHTILTGMLNQVIQLDDIHYLIAYSDGIYRYDYSMNSLTPFVTSLPVYSMEYDEVNQELFACSGNKVHVYNVVTAAPEYVVNVVDSVLDVRVMYNK